jgi:hypothetical protein
MQSHLPSLPLSELTRSCPDAETGSMIRNLSIIFALLFGCALANARTITHYRCRINLETYASKDAFRTDCISKMDIDLENSAIVLEFYARNPYDSNHPLIYRKELRRIYENRWHEAYWDFGLWRKTSESLIYEQNKKLVGIQFTHPYGINVEHLLTTYSPDGALSLGDLKAPDGKLLEVLRVDFHKIDPVTYNGLVDDFFARRVSRRVL